MKKARRCVCATSRKVNLYGDQQQTIFVDFDIGQARQPRRQPRRAILRQPRQAELGDTGRHVSRPAPSASPCASPARFNGVEAVKATPVLEANGACCSTSPISPLSRAGYADPPSFLVRQGSEPALGIGVVMAKGANILVPSARTWKAAADTFISGMPQSGIDVTQIADQPAVVDQLRSSSSCAPSSRRSSSCSASASSRRAGAPGIVVSDLCCWSWPWSSW